MFSKILSRKVKPSKNFKKRLKHRSRFAVAGFLVALLFLEMTSSLLTNTFIPGFISVAEAAYSNIDADGDGTVSAAQTTCGGGGNFDCLNDGVATSSNPGTGSDFLAFSGGNQDFYTMTTLPAVDAVSRVSVPVYHLETSANMRLSVALWDATETTQYGTTIQFANAASSLWDTAVFSGLSLTQTQLDGLRVELSCARVGGGKSNECNAYAMFAAATYTEVIDVTVGSVGTQQDLAIPTTTAHVGGSFSIVENTASRNVTSITIAEQGTVDGQNDLDNIKLFYDLDTSDPYNCAGETYSGGETQFGSTDTDGFSGANGTSVFTGSVNITTTQAMCVYPVLDVLGTVTFDETVEIQITNPATDVVGSGSPVISPGSAVLLSSTTVLRQSSIVQENYHWRNDDGSEAAATSATAGSENTAYNGMPKNSTKRVRFAVSNEGNADSTALQLRLEYATATAACSALGTWVDTGAAGGAFSMSDSASLTNGNDTTDISVGIGGVTNPNTTFLTTNGGVRDTSSQTGNITATSTEFVEVEYSIIASTAIPDGTSYCFRVTDAGTALDGYTNYPEANFSADVEVDSTGTQTAQVTIPTTGQYAGGVLRLTDTSAGSDTLTSVTITASGSIDIAADVENIKLRYDLDISNPYTCDDTSYADTDTQFGTTVTNFDGSNKATFSGSVTNSQTQTVCLYVEYDVVDTTTNGGLLDVYIASPSSEIVFTSSTVSPSSPVEISGMTTFAAPFLTQANYHWRNNDGTETGATSATGGTENTVLTEMAKSSTYRLRFALGNTGLSNAPEARYQIQWAQKISSCVATPEIDWEPIGTAADEWQMSPTGNLTEGNDTTDVLLANGGVSDPAGTFLTNNNGVNDTTDLTASSTLLADNYLDLEFAISPTTESVQGATYCFRVVANGNPLDSYTNFPEAVVKLDTDYKIQRGVSTMTGTTLTITAGSEYEVPSSTRAFIRITNTQLTGAGPNTGNTANNADDVTAYISNPGNLATSITFSRAGATGNTRVAWEIIEYIGAEGGENEMLVRRHEAVAYGAANTTVSGSVTGTIADDNDVAVFITGQNNANTGRNGYNEGLSTSAWNATNNQADFTRGVSGAVSNVSYALVEFTGSNWKVQRVEHAYSNAGAVEVQGIASVNSLTRAFLHVQMRTNQNKHADFGQEVYFSGIGQISFLLDAAAAVTTGSHTSVAWVIESTQTQGVVMDVHRSNGAFTSAGAGPETNNVNIGATLSDLSVASIFTNNRSDETQRSWPEPILAARLISTTQYELWRSDTTANLNFRTEVVEWPTAARKLEQNYYRIYVNDASSIKPSDPWPVGATNLGENAEMTANDTPMASGDIARVRMTVSVTASAVPAGLDAFKLEYGLRSEAGTCSGITSNDWHEVGGIGSTTALWRGVNNTPADGAALSATNPPTGGDLLISIGSVAGSYEEENDSSLNPYLAFPGDEVEYDWVLQHNGAADKSSYCFRMVESDSKLLENYNFYPVLRTVGYDPRITNWRWYDDEASLTPSAPLAGENVSPVDVVNQNAIKLRLVLEESSGASGIDAKFALQVSQQADFSSAVATVTPSGLCLEDSIWCYEDGSGVDNAIIDGVVISDADTCVSGVGAGCGTHNESTSSTTATFDHAALTSAEYEFTILHAGARANAVYYFRLYDVVNNELVLLAGGASYPSLVTEGAQLVFTVAGLDAGISTAGIVTDATTTAASIGFGGLPFGTSVEAAQRITINTNATEGYQLFVSAAQELLNVYGEAIPAVSSTNAAPDGWTDACLVSVTGCFGYHSTDGTLNGGDGRFAPTDSYAALSTTAEEIMYSSIPISDTHDVVYRLSVTEEQAAGDYETSIQYIAVPTF